MQPESGKDYGGAVIAGLMVVLGALAVWDTTTYGDADSSVFPRTVAIGLMVLSVAFLIQFLIGRADPAIANERGSWVRRILFVLAMLATSLVMPWVGFIPAALVSFAVLTAVAMYDRWTMKRVVVYGLVGLLVVLGFYALFAKFLLVPLPTGWLFQG